MVIVLALALGCANAVDMPVRQSFAIEMVGPRDVGNAVALNSAMFNGARVLGPAVAGLTIGAFGVGPRLRASTRSASSPSSSALSLMRDDELHRRRASCRDPARSARSSRTSPRASHFVRRTPDRAAGRRRWSGSSRRSA